MDRTQYWLIFKNDQLLIDASTNQLLTAAHLPLVKVPFTREYLIAHTTDNEFYTAEIPNDTDLPNDVDILPVRKALNTLHPDWYNYITKAYAILHWDKNHTYCGCCSHPTHLKPGSFERTCSTCQLAFYPRISPSIIVLIHNGDDILMARSPHFTPGAFGLIAGFVEAGENAEDAVHREVDEEVGIKIKNLRYFGSQPWPFPDSLMLGFIAEYDSGELNIDHEEIEIAGWYHYDNLPGRPSYHISMGHKLLEYFIANKRLTNGLV